MTRRLRVFQGSDSVPISDFTDDVAWERSTFTNAAANGQAGVSQFTLYDEEGRITDFVQNRYVNAHNVVVVDDGPYTLYRGRVNTREWGRGERRGKRIRIANITVGDYNTDLRGIVVNEWSRPEELDYVRANALITDYLSGSPRATTNLSNTYVSSSNGLNLVAKKFTGVYVGDVLNELAESADKMYFVTVDGQVFYDGLDSNAYASSLRISDDPADANSTTYAPIWDAGAASTEDEIETASHIRSYWGNEQSVTATNGQQTVTDYWELLWYDSLASGASPAATRAARRLDAQARGKYTLTCTIGPIPWSQLGSIKAGQMIQVKARAALAGINAAGYMGDQFFNFRIIELTWKHPAPEINFATLRLNMPPRNRAAGIGDPGRTLVKPPTSGGSVGQALLFSRLYFSDDNAGVHSVSSAWNADEHADGIAHTLKTTAEGTSVGNNTSSTVVPGNTCLYQGKYIFSSSVTFTGGSVRSQGWGKMRSGLGIGHNIGQSQLTIRLFDSSNALKGTLLSVHNPAGLDSTEWSNERTGGPNPPKRNTTYPADATYASSFGAPLEGSLSAVSGDYILVEWGVRYFSYSGAAGVNTDMLQNQAADLPDNDNTQTSAGNCWIEFWSADQGPAATTPPSAPTGATGSVGTSSVYSPIDHTHGAQDADITTIDDDGGYFPGASNVEDALQLLGAGPPMVVKELLNRTGGAVIHGDVVKTDTSNESAFTSSGTLNYNDAQLMIVQDDVILNDDLGRVLLSGYADRVNIGSNTTTRGFRLYGSNMALRAYASNSRTAGAFGIVLSSNADPPAIIWSTTDPTAGAGGGGGSSAITGATDINTYTGGDITLNNTTLTAVTGPTDLVVAAAAGDCLMVGVSARPVTTTAQSIAFDFATMVSGSPVNYVFAASGTPINIPVPWYIGSGEVSACNGAYPYVVQAGDISAGTVTLRLYFRTSGSRVIEADAAAPLVTWVHNLKQ